MSESIGANKKRTLTLQALRGTSPAIPTRLDGVPVWEASAPGIVGLFPSSDGMTCDVTNIAPGTVTVTVKADADLTPAVRELAASVEILCVEGEADRLAIAVGPETDI